MVPCACCSGNNFIPALECEGFSFVRCADCNLVQRNPQFSEDEIIERYKTSFGSDYLSYEMENEAVFLNLQLLALADIKFFKLEKKIFSAAEQGKRGSPSFLDIGCATGALLFRLNERGWRVTGVEISPSAEYAQKERYLDVKTAPLEENSFPSASFDVIHASHLIEHLNNPKNFLQECFRILKKDGTIFITTPNIAGFQSRLFGSAWRSAIFDHLYLFSISTLTKMLKAAGFKKTKCRTWGGLAAGFSPKWLKKPADRLAKLFGFGDVMIIEAKKMA